MSPSTESSPTESPPAIADVLRRIVEKRRERLAEARVARPGVRLEADAAAPLLRPEKNRFLAALSTERAGRAVISEVKMGSPRLGSLVGRFDPAAQARTYAENGAAALSVVVEPDFFHGSYEILAECTRASGLPAIAKDFLVDDLQLVWAQEAGAAAVLLIAALYSAEDLRVWAQKARELGLVPLIETHDAADLDKLEGDAWGANDWELVGINNRDLRTFEVDLEHSLHLLPRLPSEAIKVAESGLHEAADVERLHRAGFQAFLIGESLVTAGDPAAKLRELIG